MPPSRRDFLEFASAFSIAAAHPAVVQAASEQKKIKALAFDAFPIFDPRKISHIAFDIYGDQGHKLALLWFSRLFNYMFIVSAADQYQKFEIIARNSLRYTARSMGIVTSHSDEDKLIRTFYELPIWPDVLPALKILQTLKIKNIFLSNMPSDMLLQNIKNNNVSEYFDNVIGSDAMECYKPSPEAYRKALTVSGLFHDEIGFVAFGQWDAIGATWFGYKTAWINRTNSPPEEFDATPQFVTTSIEGALLLVK